MVNDYNFLINDVVVNERIIHICPVSTDLQVLESKLVENQVVGNRYASLLKNERARSTAAVGDYCEIDFDKKMAMIALVRNVDGSQQEVAVARYVTDDFDYCEVVIAVTEEWHQHSLGQILLKTLFDFARHKGRKMIYATDKIDNDYLRVLARDLRMQGQRDPYDATSIRYERFLK